MPAMARDGEVIQRQHFCHHGDTIYHPKSGYVTTKLQGTSVHVDAIIMRCFRQSYFLVSYRRRMPAMLIWPGQSLDGSC